MFIQLLKLLKKVIVLLLLLVLLLSLLLSLSSSLSSLSSSSSSLSSLLSSSSLSSSLLLSSSSSSLLSGGPKYLEDTDDEGRTPLHYAAMFGQTRVAKFLIKIGADKKKIDIYKMQPGQLAQEYGYEVTAQLILSFARMPPKTEDQLQYIINESNRIKDIPLQDTLNQAFNSLSNMFNAGLSMFSSAMSKK